MHILFLSANDFKEKSIQIIRKTPEAFVDAGHEVTYIVLRDYSKTSSYFYEKEINPEGIKVIRKPAPFIGLRNFFHQYNFLVTILTQLAAYKGAYLLYKLAQKELKSNKVDVIYGYEVQGVNAIRLLKRRRKLRGIKVVTRFQGTWISKYLKENNKLKLALNYDDITALKTHTDLCIMTDDGTEGDYALESLRSPAFNSLRFWVNGVDQLIQKETEYADLVKRFNPNGDKQIVLSVCRLEPWKRVDRIIEVIKESVYTHHCTSILYIVIGEGSESNKLKALAQKWKLTDYIHFEGAVDNCKVKQYLNMADYFFSTYDLSNVGNPLLEAIRTHNIIFTLNNGTTAQWIKHKQNGFIYNINEKLIVNMSQDFCQLLKDEKLRKSIIEEIVKTEKLKLWTWQERFEAEVKEVESLIK